MEKDQQNRYVTTAELKAEIEKIPTRWEVRFLIALAVVANQIVPAGDIARAALEVIPK